MAKPKPFQNPRIEVVSSWIGSKKEWMDITPDRISEGDIIIGKGLIVTIRPRTSAFDEGTGKQVTRYRFEMKSGQLLIYKSTDVVRVFTQGVSPWPAP